MGNKVVRTNAAGEKQAQQTTSVDLTKIVIIQASMSTFRVGFANQEAPEHCFPAVSSKGVNPFQVEDAMIQVKDWDAMEDLVGIMFSDKLGVEDAS